MSIGAHLEECNGTRAREVYIALQDNSTLIFVVTVSGQQYYEEKQQFTEGKNC